MPILLDISTIQLAAAKKSFLEGLISSSTLWHYLWMTWRSGIEYGIKRLRLCEHGMPNLFSRGTYSRALSPPRGTRCDENEGENGRWISGGLAMGWVSESGQLQGFKRAHQKITIYHYLWK